MVCINADDGSKLKKTIGKQNFDLQIETFSSNTVLCFIDNNEKLLTEPKSYDLDINNFLEFLDEGVENFDKDN